MRRGGGSSKRRSAVFPAMVLLLAAGRALAAPDVVHVPGGQTLVGSVRGRPDERPTFMATVAAFDMDRTPVTVGQFAEFVRRAHFITEAERHGNSAVMTFGTGQWRLVDGANWRKPEGPAGPDAEPTHPVTHVSWNDANRYCAASGMRLPTEVEWEHAARAGGSPLADGGPVEKNGHYRANVWTGVFPGINTAADGYRTTSPVGAFGAGPLGLTDMAGNVWEWTSDWYRPYDERDQPWDASAQGEPRAGWPARPEKVQRGGSFLCDAKVCYGFRVTARGHATPDSSHMHVGFRCVQSATTTARK